MRNKLNVALITLLFFGANPSWAGESGTLSGEAANFIEHSISPILVRAKFCGSAQDCVERGYIYYGVGDAIHYYVYGITDEKVIKEILISILNSGLRVSSITFWRSKHHEKSFFEKPILDFTDHTGDK